MLISGDVRYGLMPREALEHYCKLHGVSSQALHSWDLFYVSVRTLFALCVFPILVFLFFRFLGVTSGNGTAAAYLSIAAGLIGAVGFVGIVRMRKVHRVRNKMKREWKRVRAGFDLDPDQQITNAEFRDRADSLLLLGALILADLKIRECYGKSGASHGLTVDDVEDGFKQARDLFGLFMSVDSEDVYWERAKKKLHPLISALLEQIEKNEQVPPSSK